MTTVTKSNATRILRARAGYEPDAMIRKLDRAKRRIKRLEQAIAATGERPCVQVLKYDPRVGHSYWIDFISLHRSSERRESHLRKLVKTGVIGGYRIGSTREVRGYVPKQRKAKAAPRRNKGQVR